MKQPMLTDNPVRPKALLSISAMIHAYCRNNGECHLEKVVRQAVSHIENHIGIACRSRDEAEQKTILLALKSLGNAGLIVFSAETLKKCYQVILFNQLLNLHLLILKFLGGNQLDRYPFGSHRRFA